MTRKTSECEGRQRTVCSCTTLYRYTGVLFLFPLSNQRTRRVVCGVRVAERYFMHNQILCVEFESEKIINLYACKYPIQL